MSAQPSPFKMLAVPRAGGVLLSLEGVLNEQFDVQQFVDLAQGGSLVVDLNGVVRVTSFGVRQWMTALQQIKAESVAFTHCRPSVVAQFNSVARFGGQGQVVSLFAPYLCPSCGHDVEVPIDLLRQYDQLKRGALEQVACPMCGAATEFDDDPRTYFSYVLSRPAPVVSAELAAVLDDGPRELTVDKVVEGSVTGVWLSGELHRSPGLKRLFDGLEGDVVLVLDGMGRIWPDGLEQLTRLVNAEGPRLLLARVASPLREALSASPQSLGRAGLMSLHFDPLCLNGHQVPVDIDLRWLRDAAATVAPCVTCGASVEIGALLEVARRSPLVEAPAIVQQFLHGHRLPPERVGAQAQHTPRPAPATSGRGGRAFFGRYELLRRLGRGGMAEVFLAEQHAVGGFVKKVVLKRILPGLSADHYFREMFLQEARLAAQLSHPNVVQIFDVDELDGALIIAMEYVEGSDLNRLLRAASRAHAPFSPVIAARMIADVCAGLSAAHTSVMKQGELYPIIHRDVSPHNVMISSRGMVKITDFGIAKAVDSIDHTPSSTMKGKVSYIAPELIRPGKKEIDPRIDIFPVAIMLYQLLSLQHPFRRENEYDTLIAIVKEPLPDIRTLVTSVPEALWLVCQRGLERDPAMRYQTALAMQNDLEAFLVEAGEFSGTGSIARFCSPLFDALGSPEQHEISEPTDGDSGVNRTVANRGEPR